MCLKQDEIRLMRKILTFYMYHHLSAHSPQVSEITTILDKISRDINLTVTDAGSYHTGSSGGDRRPGSND